MRFQCSPFHTTIAFWPSIDALERALKLRREESAQSRLDKLEPLAVGHYRRPEPDVRFIAPMPSVPYQDCYGQ